MANEGTLDNPIVVKSYGDEQYMGCTGSPADTHVVIWLTASRDRPIERCPECGSVYKMEYVGPADAHHDAHGGSSHDVRKSTDWMSYGEPSTNCSQTATPTAHTTTAESQRPWPTLSVPSTDRGLCVEVDCKILNVYTEVPTCAFIICS